MTRILVYGLLRQGQSMGGMLAGAEPLGRRRVAGYQLYDLGDYPAAVPGDGELVAELYRLPEDAAAAQLRQMDEAEGADAAPPLYRRAEVALDDGPAWLYVYARPTGAAPRIASGDWLDR